jgi:hypothetical protein
MGIRKTTRPKIARTRLSTLVKFLLIGNFFLKADAPLDTDSSC